MAFSSARSQDRHLRRSGTHIMLRLRTILHPTDFSCPSKHALHLASSLARDHGGRLIVLHVAEPPVVGYGSPMKPPPGGDWRALEHRLFQVKPQDAIIPVEHRLELGNPVAEILRVARETSCDLIVMGSHGGTGLSHLLMGSVAEKVVRKASCPVLVVKTPLPAIVFTPDPRPEYQTEQAQ
jgi:universal stress protein A